MNHQKFKLAAPGTGFIAYTRPYAEDRTLAVLLSNRTASVGAGFGITGGGFVECGDIDRSPVGSIVEAADEAWREGDEENVGFGQLVSSRIFFEEAQPIATLFTRTTDINRVHSCTFFALRLQDRVWQQATRLSPGPERVGDLVIAILRWKKSITRRDPEKFITLQTQTGDEIHAGDFCHQHELRAFGALAWHAERNRLW
ncbi:MAG: hypothetical protein WDZ93_02550 [Candidatus Paceibacterota bacterium]